MVRLIITAALLSLTMSLAAGARVNAGVLCQTRECECAKGYYLDNEQEFNRYCSGPMVFGAKAKPNYWPVIIPIITIFSVTAIGVVGYTYTKKKRNK